MKQSLSKLADIIMNLIVNTKLGKIPWEKSAEQQANSLDDEKLNMLSELLPSVDTSALKIS